jgi:hypothetical protein
MDHTLIEEQRIAERYVTGKPPPDEAERAAAAAKKLRLDLAREQEARAKANEELAAARRSQVNVPILYPDAERGAGEPSQRLHLPRSPGWIVFTLTAEGRRFTFRVLPPA